ncbi:MAG: prepilin-type N-terminal cleavage/methylation domain-containing protein [Phycisphaerales bacterium]|nr:prepilin-type N-terminal cleavage/methylation domain-containing protein [Phycisphaerae bacterium]NNF44581.1 prepilin-type N-terminal cleavage/methylation domain-containing protein [Phycisphaerales bacterium]NNM26826.1 prepilin-type N-terminal cleavage/methylation domain-containing protein [Phycisphaerales bacterium]
MRETGPASTRAFTIIELLVVVSIIALLVGVLLPAIGRARDQSRQAMSGANLRNLATAHGSYAAEWGDRQFTMVDDNIAVYGESAGPAFEEYYNRNGADGWLSWHPPVHLGRTITGGEYAFFNAPGQVGNHGLTQPIVFRGEDGIRYFGSFRIPNCTAFNQYVSGKFYEKVFYAPKDTVVVDRIIHTPGGWSCFDDPAPYCVTGGSPAWCSYVLSPAAMFSPDVLANPDRGGYTTPFELKAGFRSPSFSQALYPSLKTHMLEHHWLQSRRAECNPAFDPGGHYACQPYFFNASWESQPMTLFYDGHVESVGVRKAMRHDGRVETQSGHGLWSRDTTFGENGYYIDAAYDQAATSFHILTTDGIRGRDFVSD